MPEESEAVYPDPNGECPEDWRPCEWRAYGLLSSGVSYRETGRQCTPPVQAGTVSGWVSKWRAKYGRGIITSSRANAFTPEARSAGAQAAGDVTAIRWAKRRHSESDEYGAAATSALELAARVVQRISDDEDAVAALEVDDALKLGRLADLFAQRADILAGIDNKGRIPVGPEEGAPGAKVEADIFSAFRDDIGDDGRKGELLRQVRIVATEIRSERGEEPIDVESSTK